MAGNWLTGSGWVIVVFIGAFVLFGAIVWARRKNQTDVTPQQHRQSEAATRDLYQDPLDHDSTGGRQ